MVIAQLLPSCGLARMAGTEIYPDPNFFKVSNAAA